MPKSQANPVKYFLTVSWCNEKPRGIFCTRTGRGFSRDDRPHTEEEMCEILGPFWLVLNAQSLPFIESDLAKLSKWYPLAEYSNEYGYATLPKGA